MVRGQSDYSYVSVAHDRSMCSDGSTVSMTGLYADHQIDEGESANHLESRNPSHERDRTDDTDDVSLSTLCPFSASET